MKYLNKDSSKEVFTEEEYQEVIKLFKHNICQNMRIARKLSGLDSETASEHLFLEAQSLRRLEAINDRDEFSLKVFIMALLTYNQDADFYFEDYKENEKLLNETSK